MVILHPSGQDLFEGTRAEMSPTEKAIARPCVDRALRRDLDAVIQSTKQTPAEIRQSPELWKLEHHLTQVSKEIESQV
jgi:hypothetical protein